MTDNPVPDDEGNDDEATTDPERSPMPPEDPETEPVHEGAGEAHPRVVTMALKRVGIPSPNYSSRGGSSVRLYVCTPLRAHDLPRPGGVFPEPGQRCLDRIGIDDTPNTVGKYVQRSGKAWTAAAANPYSIQAELCAFAEWGTATSG